MDRLDPGLGQDVGEVAGCQGKNDQDGRVLQASVERGDDDGHADATQDQEDQAGNAYHARKLAQQGDGAKEPDQELQPEL